MAQLDNLYASMFAGGTFNPLLLNFDAFKPKDYTKFSDEELVKELQRDRDFDKLVFPDAWYSKFELPVKSCRNMKEYIKESPWMRTSQHWYIEKKEIEAKPGGLRPILPAEEAPTFVLQYNSFSDAPPGSLTLDALIGKTSLSNQQETHESSACSTEATDSKSQE